MAAPPTLRRFVESLRPQVIIECGAHVGEDTAWMAAIPGCAIHAFEPDPRNAPPAALLALPQVHWTPVAVSDRGGEVDFYPSAKLDDGRPWTESGSLRAPLEHLKQYPYVAFGERTRVRTVTLDGYCRGAGVEYVDLIWADVQGAELDMLKGAEETIARTLWMVLELSDHEMYAGQARRAEIVAWLAERGWRIVTEEAEGPASNALIVNERLVPDWKRHAS